MKTFLILIILFWAPILLAEESPSQHSCRNNMDKRSNSAQAAPSGEICSLPTNDDELKKLLTPEQYAVTRQNGTERPFANAYWNNKKEGLYVDIISGEPLFSSKDKFDSGTGWPSFTKPLKSEAVVNKTDATHGMIRTEVRSKTADSHLGHVFDDGPGPGGQRYCINSASLRFVPLEDLEKEGYGEYRKFFSEKASSLK